MYLTFDKRVSRIRKQAKTFMNIMMMMMMMMINEFQCLITSSVTILCSHS